MSLLNSLYSGVTGLRNQQTMLDVIGNNIANVNTIGFKGSRVTFSDTFNQLVRSGSNPSSTNGGTNSFQVGLGSKLNSVDRNWSQGTFERTGITTDLGLQGSGLFIVKNNGQKFYTRAGAFVIDASGKLVNPNNGAIVQGKNGTNGVIPAGNTLEDIKIDSTLKMPAVATTEVKWSGNLKSSSAVTQTSTVYQSGSISSSVAVGEYLEPTTGAGSATKPVNGFTQKVYNTYGEEFTLHTYWKKTAANTWTTEYDVRDSNNTSITLDAGTSSVTGITFDAATGAMTAPASLGTGFTISSAANSLSFKYIANDATHKIAEGTSTATVQTGDGAATGVNASVVVYDSLGNAHTVTLKFGKDTSTNKWNWIASVPASSTASLVSASSKGTITFDNNGRLDPSNIIPNLPKLSFSPVGGAALMTVDLNFGKDFSGVTQTASTSAISALYQDGSPASSLTNIAIDQFGNINGIFSNGKTQTLAQILVATFANRNGLVSAGDNLYEVATNSGEPNVGIMGEETNTTIQSGSLEQSNIDLTEEFTKMIVSQRGFQANARVVSVSDQIIQELTGLVR